ncbi:hypothetical protein SLE2022_186730 [Rubroshorea leprosula]
MRLVTDSPVHSSGSGDDFAAYLDAELDSGSSDSPSDQEVEAYDIEPDENAEDYDDHESERTKRLKVEVQDVLDPEGSTSPFVIEKNVEVSVGKDICTHPASYQNMCIVCGKDLNFESGVSVGYIQQGLRLGNDEMVRIRKADLKNLLHSKKLYLVLDLDHTLLNSTLLTKLTLEEEYLKGQTDSCQDIPKGSLFQLDSMPMMTKLRPFVHTFLKEASEMFEMYIYTMGDRAYALKMAKLLDPSGEYFNAKVISRDDGTQKHQKGLDVVLGDESAILILDDTESAWPMHKDNLILMDRYHFFASSCQQFGLKCKSLSQMNSDESEIEGVLSSVLRVLRQIHHMFFDELDGNLGNKDVRQVLKTVRNEILKGCNIVFSHVFSIKCQADKQPLWIMAEQLGATCSKELDPSVTHVVSEDARTEKSRWAVKENKFLVYPRWIEAANFLWQKQPEENFPVARGTTDPQRG